VNNNKTNPADVMKFFREQRQARQLQAMNYGGISDPTKKIVAGPGVPTNAVGKPAGSQNQQVTKYPKPKRESFGARQARLTGRF